MKYELTSPCSTCPFLTKTAFEFHPQRAKEIIEEGLACHNTTTTKGRSVRHPKAQACAGRLILLERENQPDQMMRIAERLGLYDRRKLNMDHPGVFSTLKGWFARRSEK